MRANDIQNVLKAQPFMPIRVHISDGSHHDVRHPEMLMVSKTVVSVAIYAKDDASLPESIIFCDPVHITRIEPLNGARVAPNQKPAA